MCCLPPGPSPATAPAENFCRRWPPKAARRNRLSAVFLRSALRTAQSYRTHRQGPQRTRGQALRRPHHHGQPQHQGSVQLLRQHQPSHRTQPHSGHGHSQRPESGMRTRGRLLISPPGAPFPALPGASPSKEERFRRVARRARNLRTAQPRFPQAERHVLSHRSMS